MVDRESLAWAGGLFEGEGCFTVRRPKEGGVYAGAQLAMTDLDRVERFRECVGVGFIRVHTPAHDRYKQVWAWQVSSLENTQAVVAMLWPWLGPRRRGRASEILVEVETSRRDRRAA